MRAQEFVVALAEEFTKVVHVQLSMLEKHTNKNDTKNKKIITNEMGWVGVDNILTFFLNLNLSLIQIS